MTKRYDYRQILGPGTGTPDDPMQGREGCVTMNMVKTDANTYVVTNYAVPAGATVSGEGQEERVATCPDNGKVSIFGLARSLRGRISQVQMKLGQ